MEESCTTQVPTLRLLFVQDNPLDAELALDQLRKGGFQVTVDIVQTAEDFRSKLASVVYDVVLSDLGLPKWSGLDALEILKQTSLDLPFIMVTGAVGEETVSGFFKMGATDYVFKNRPTRLPAAIRGALQAKVLREERRRAQEQILRLAAIVESSDDAIISKALDGTIVNWNAGAEKLYGYRAEEVIGRPATIIAPPEKSGEMPQILERLQRGEGVDHFETVRLRRDGQRVDVSLTVSSIRDSTGKMVGASEIARNIMERKRVDSKLRASEIRYRRLFEAARDGILILDADSGEIRDVNPFLTDLLGFSQDELLGRKLWDIGPLRDVLLNKVDFVELQSKGFIRYENLPLESRDGRCIEVEFVSNVYFAADKKVIQCNIRDITERKQAEKTLRKSEERFRQITETIDEVFWMAAPQITEVSYISPGYERVWGRTQASLYEDPRSLLEAVHYKDREGVLRHLEVRKSGQAFDHEYRIIRPDGVIRWIWDRGFPVRDEKGKSFAMWGLPRISPNVSGRRNGCKNTKRRWKV